MTIRFAGGSRCRFMACVAALWIAAATPSSAQQPATPKSVQPPVAADTQIKIFNLVNARAEEIAQVLQAIGPGNREVNREVRIAIDPRTNSIVVSGPAVELQTLEAVALRLDEQETPKTAAGDSGKGRPSSRFRPEAPPPREIRVRVLWLVAEANKAAPARAAPGPAGLPGAEGPGAPFVPPAPASRNISALLDPPDDLADVVQELHKIGIKSPKLAAQTVVNGTANHGDFRMSGATTLPVPTNLTISGQVGDDPTGGLQSTLQIDVRETNNSRSLCNISTTIATPPGQFVVLGVTPTDDLTSIFVVQITAKSPPASKTSGK